MDAICGQCFPVNQSRIVRESFDRDEHNVLQMAMAVENVKKCIAGIKPPI